MCIDQPVDRDRKAIIGYSTLSYAPFSTIMILSKPLTFAASSATGLILLPAKKPVTEAPSFWAAVTALSEAFFSCPSLCSSIARVESSRTTAVRCAPPLELKVRIAAVVCLRVG